MQKDLLNIISSALFPFLLLIILWIIGLYQYFSNVLFIHFGILPLEPKALTGIITHIFVHANLEHLISNSFPLFFLMWCLFYFYKPLAWVVFIVIYVSTGLWLWLFGREAWHIGASGIIYGLGSFLFTSGLLRKEKKLMALSLLIIFLYGSMVWGVFPLQPHISWEAHLLGLIAGIVVAIYYKKHGPQAQNTTWEDEDDDNDDENAYWKVTENTQNQPH